MSRPALLTTTCCFVSLFQLHNLSDLDAAAIVDIVKDIEDPSDAAKVLVMKSAELWADRNDYCDDITAIVIFVSINKSDEDSDDGGILIE